eukprot:m.56790 g.56790  ORF g.56790 m.56790 type:complete len:63 (-) comp7812_c0_seq8:3375-3563(-)
MDTDTDRACTHAYAQHTLVPPHSLTPSFHNTTHNYRFKRVSSYRVRQTSVVIGDALMEETML